MKPPHKLGILALSALGVALLVWAYGTFRPKDSEEIVLGGNVDIRQVNLSFRVAGRIAEMKVDEGDRVEAGTIVAVLDKSYFTDDVRLARARVDTQNALLGKLQNGTRPEEIAQARAVVGDREASLKLAQATLGRQEELADRGVSPHQRHDEATAASEQAQASLNLARESLKLAEIGPRREDIDAAKAQLEAEKAALEQAERRLADAELPAPSTGIILSRVREPGAVVAAGETVYALSIVSPVWIRTYVSEPDLGRIRSGMPVVVRTDSGQSYKGQIGFISPVAEFTPKSVETKEMRTSLVYRVRVIVDGNTAGLLQGMPVTIVAGKAVGP